MLRKQRIPDMLFTLSVIPTISLHQQLTLMKSTHHSRTAMYYCSCESFSLNHKLCITSERLVPKFPNPGSQTSLRGLIYLAMFAQVLFFCRHMLSTAFV